MTGPFIITGSVYKLILGLSMVYVGIPLVILSGLLYTLFYFLKKEKPKNIFKVLFFIFLGLELILIILYYVF